MNNGILNFLEIINFQGWPEYCLGWHHTTESRDVRRIQTGQALIDNQSNVTQIGQE